MTDDFLYAISLHQPWASLIFGPSFSKRHETRHWPMPERLAGQRVLIHAAKTFRRGANHRLTALCERELGGPGFIVPRGAFLGTVIFASCVPTELARPHSEDDLLSGDWSERRYAWELREPEKLAQPIPARGMQGIWKVERSLLG